MILRFFKSNGAGMIFFIPILAMLLWSNIFYASKDAVFITSPYHMPAYQWLMYLIPNFTFSRILALILIIAQAFYLVHINQKYNFISHRTFLTSFLFIIISSTFLDLHYLHPLIVANIFILAVIVQIFSGYKKTKLYKQSFNIGFLIALAGLFYFNANFLLLFVFISFIVLHTFNWREWFITIIGFISPYVFIIIGYFYFDKLNNFYQLIQNIVHYHSPKLLHNFSSYFFIGVLASLSILSIIRLSQTYSNNKVSTRNYFSLFVILLILITSIFLFIPFASIELIILAAIPLSYLIANYYLSKNKSWIKQISFILLLLSFIFFYIQDIWNIGASI